MVQLSVEILVLLANRLKYRGVETDIILSGTLVVRVATVAFMVCDYVSEEPSGMLAVGNPENSDTGSRKQSGT